MLFANCATFLARLSNTRIIANTSSEFTISKRSQQVSKEKEGKEGKLIDENEDLFSKDNRGEYRIPTKSFEDILDIFHSKLKKRNTTHEFLASCRPILTGSISEVQKRNYKGIWDSDADRSAAVIIGAHSSMRNATSVVSNDTAFINSMVEPVVGPPLGETGCSSVGYNYLGTPRMNGLTFFVNTFDPHWCTRKIELSLGKLLRRSLKLASNKIKGLESPFHNYDSFFQSFRKALENIDTFQYIMEEIWNDPKYKTAWTNCGIGMIPSVESDIRSIWDGKFPIIESRHKILVLLVCRLIFGTYYLPFMNRCDKNYLQLWIDSLLDLAEFIFMGGKHGTTSISEMTDVYLKRSGAYILLYPHGRRFVHIGELPDMAGCAWRSNLWRDHPVSEKDHHDRFITVFFNKLMHHKCLIRRYHQMSKSPPFPQTPPSPPLLPELP